MMIHRLALLAEIIIDNYIAPEHRNAGEIQDVRKILGIDKKTQIQKYLAKGNVLDATKYFEAKRAELRLDH